MKNQKYQSEVNKARREPVILLVEDDLLLRCTTGEYLRLSGFLVIEAANAVEAMAVFASGKPVDAVFSDVSLSAAMDGVMLARWLRRHHPHVPVMLTSGYGGSARGAATQLVGDESFLSKPYRQTAAANRLRALLEKVRAETS
jgi:CheY-like chemotaxis protein